MTYNQQRTLAIAVAIVLGMLGAVTVADQKLLGISPVVGAWLAVAATGLGILQSFLPSVRGTDAQPEHIANRIKDLTPDERRELLTDLERWHAQEGAA